MGALGLGVIKVDGEKAGTMRLPVLGGHVCLLEEIVRLQLELQPI